MICKAGNGGKGMVSFRRAYAAAFGGPDGGNGGHGAHIIFEGKVLYIIFLIVGGICKHL